MSQDTVKSILKNMAWIEEVHQSGDDRWSTLKGILVGLTRQPEQRNDAETPIPAATNSAAMIECENCGVPRFVHGVILEACPNCGNDETDLNYYAQFGFWHMVRQYSRRWFRSLFRICPDCDKPLWWKPDSHKGCIPF